MSGYRINTPLEVSETRQTFYVISLLGSGLKIQKFNLTKTSDPGSVAYTQKED